MIRLSGEAGRAPVPEADDGPLADDVGLPIAGDDLEIHGRGEAQLLRSRRRTGPRGDGRRGSRSAPSPPIGNDMVAAPRLPPRLWSSSLPKAERPPTNRSP